MYIYLTLIHRFVVYFRSEDTVLLTLSWIVPVPLSNYFGIKCWFGGEAIVLVKIYHSTLSKFIYYIYVNHLA
jgi:hypothetical protein